MIGHNVGHVALALLVVVLALAGCANPDPYGVARISRDCQPTGVPEYPVACSFEYTSGTEFDYATGKYERDTGEFTFTVIGRRAFEGQRTAAAINIQAIQTLERLGEPITEASVSLAERILALQAGIPVVPGAGRATE